MSLEEEVIALYKSGVGAPTIFKRLTPQVRSTNAVLKILEGAGIKRRKAPNQQGMSGTRVLTSEDDREIATLYLGGKTSTEIFKLFKGRIKQNKSILDSLKRSGIDCKQKWEYTKLDHHFFSNIDSEAKAYFLGWLISDGWVQLESNEIGLQVQSGDEYIIHLLKKVLTTEIPILPTRGMFRLAVHSPIMKTDLAKYGVVPQKSVLSFLPYLSLEWMAPLIRGLIDGDGCLHLTPEGTLHINLCGTFQLCSGVRQFLADHLKVSQPKISPNTSIYVVTWAEHSDVEKIIKYLWQPTVFCLPRKSKLALGFK